MRIPRKSTIFQAFPAAWAAAWVAGGLAYALLVSPSVRARENSIEGRRVAEIHIVDEAGKPISGKLPALPLEPGKPFDFAAERASLRALYFTGDYSDIRVTEEPEADGLRVDFIVRRNYYNNVVRIEGLKEPPTEPAALAALRLPLGEPFRASSVREAVLRLEDALRAEGLFLAKVTWDLLPHEDTRQMDITIHVDSGA